MSNAPQIAELKQSIQALWAKERVLKSALAPLAAIPIGGEIFDDRDLILYKNGGRAITVGDVLNAKDALGPKPMTSEPAISAQGGGVPPAGSGLRPDGLSQSSLSQAEPLVPNAAPYGEPITTVEELDALDTDEVIEGYRDGRDNEPPPTGNRSRSYWHGWRNGMADGGHLPIDPAMRELARQVIAQSRKAQA